jgi:hypothetical protein
LIDHGQHRKPTIIHKPITHEVHAPALIEQARPIGCWSGGDCEGGEKAVRESEGAGEEGSGISYPIDGNESLVYQVNMLVVAGPPTVVSVEKSSQITRALASSDVASVIRWIDAAFAN